MANLKTNLIEFGVSFVFLVIFLALLATADTAGQWSTAVYLGAVVAFTIAICLFGLKLAPYMYDQYS